MRYYALWVRITWLVLLSLLLASCQPQFPATVTILDGGQIHRLTTNERIPANLLTEAGIALAPNDQVLVNGLPFPREQTLPAGLDVLQVRRAMTVRLVTPGGEQELTTTAQMVGSALSEAGIQLYAVRFHRPARRDTCQRRDDHHLPSSAGVEGYDQRRGSDDPLIG